MVCVWVLVHRSTCVGIRTSTCFLALFFLGFLGAAGGGWRCCRFLFVAVNALDLRHGVFHMTIYSCVGVLAYITSG